METRKFKDLTIRDAFMFAAVMSDPEICRKVLELALGFPVSEVHVQTERTMAYHSEYHGVRLDVYAADAGKTRQKAAPGGILRRNFCQSEVVIIMTR